MKKILRTSFFIILALWLSIGLMLGTVAMAVPFAVTQSAFITTPMVSAGNERTVTLRSDGTVWAWGRNDHEQLNDNTIMRSLVPVQVQNLTNITSIAVADRIALLCTKTALYGVGEAMETGNWVTEQ